MYSVRHDMKMHTIFMNSKNSKTSDSYRLLLSIIDKTDWRRKGKYEKY